MIYFWITVLFLFGAALGSFLLVIANRSGTGLPFWGGRSFCFACNKNLKGKDLIPIFSFIFLRGRCRYCQTRIPIKAFLIEILVGGLAILTAWKFSFIFSDFSTISFLRFGIFLAIVAMVVLISVYDLEHFIIPDTFLVVLFIFTLIFLFINQSQSLINSVVAGIALSVPFLLIFLVSKGRWLGFGDVKYIAVLGFWLGLAAGFSAVILAFWIGAAFALIALLANFLKVRLPIISQNLTIKSEVPFGPFLSLGALVSFYLNLDILQLKSIINVF